MIIRKDVSWIALFGLACAVSLWFTGVAIYWLWAYLRLDAHVPATIKEWEVIEKGASKFLIGASYSYQVDGVTYDVKSFFREPAYLNRPSAEKEIKNLSPRAWRVWIDSSRPYHASFQKIFPYKMVVYALISSGIAVYFCLFRRRVFLKLGEV